MMRQPVPRSGWVRRRAALAALLAAAGAGAAAAQGRPPAAVVVWDFDNQTPPGATQLAPAQLDYLRRALSEKLTARLMDGAGVSVVERQRLRDVLAEQKLASSDLVDADTRVRLGRIVGAGRMVFGGFFALGSEVQVHLRLVETGTSRILFSDEFIAPAAAVIERAEAAAARLIAVLGGSATAASEYPASVWQAHDRALTLSDAGRFEEAIAALQHLLAEHKDFAPAERQLIGLLEKMSRR